MDLGTGFLTIFLLGGLFYLLYLLVPLLGFWLWRKGQAGWIWPLAIVWVLGVFVVPVVDFQRARLQSEEAWALAVLPDTVPIDGESFVTNDTVRTPHTAIQRFNAPGRMFGLFNWDETAAAVVAGPVDFADLRFFEHLPAPGECKDRKQVETSPGTRVSPDFLMLSNFHRPERDLLHLLNHPSTDALPRHFGVDYVIVEVPDPAAFDLRTARIVMLLP
ncbi:MAG: hypothetical protein AAF252_06640, partial [Pseudomonadota bacterium]